MRKTKKLTLSSMFTALSVVLLWLGGLVEVLDLSSAVIASLGVVFIHVELRAPWSFGVWAGTSFLAILLFHSSASLYYTVFCGLYAILKAYLERLRRPVSWILKFVTFNVLFTAAYLLARFVFLFPDYEEAGWLLFALYAVANVAFLCYDVVLSMCVTLYSVRLRPRIARFLK